MTGQDNDKRLAALAALDEVRDGMRVGLGTGSTVAFLIPALAERITAGLAIEVFATSEATTAAAYADGIAVREFANAAPLDLAIDGADEIDARFFAIKGGGGAMLREKVVAASARRMVVIADGSKRVAAIGLAPLPVEVLPFARRYVVGRLEALGAVVTIRPGYATDNGNLVADCRFAAMPDPPALAAAIDAIPGALGHGLFLDEVDAAYIADRGVVTRVERGGSSD